MTIDDTGTGNTLHGWMNSLDECGAMVSFTVVFLKPAPSSQFSWLTFKDVWQPVGYVEIGSVIGFRELIEGAAYGLVIEHAQVFEYRVPDHGALVYAKEADKVCRIVVS